MPYTLKFLIPTLLGLAAAGINWVMLSSKAGTVQFVRVKNDIEAGRPLRREDLEVAELPLDFKCMRETAIPFSEIGLLEGQIAQRTLNCGDLVLNRDTTIYGLPDIRKGENVLTVDISEVPVVPRLMRIGYKISFRIPSPTSAMKPVWVGPFRIVAVDSIINNDEGGTRQSPSTVTVAYDFGENNSQSNALRKFLDERALSGTPLIDVALTPTGH